MSKPILCLDFDGVCHSYKSGWKGADVIPDEYVDGLFEFLEDVKNDFDVQVFSSRSHQKGGAEAMLAWFYEQRKLWRSRGGKPPVDMPLTISFPTEKPPALITLDDRGILFEGKWPTLEALKVFKPWYLREVVMAERPQASPINVHFNQKRIRPDGELGSVTITQGVQELDLTPEQARALANAITTKLGE